MKLVAIVRQPERPEEAAQVVAAAAGLTLAEARMRLAPEPPVLLARLEPDAAGALVAALRAGGLAALAIDAHVPSDRDRLPVRAFALGAAGVTLTPRAGDAMVVEWPQVLAILRGLRASRSEVERTVKVRKPSLGAALVTGGLKVTRTATATARSSQEEQEQVILLYARDGRAATLADTGLDFSCLGPSKQPSSTANMVALAQLLRERAGGAFYDERLLRLGRRALPLVVDGAWRARSSAVTTTRTDTSGSLDTLAEVLRQAVAAGLLP